jgi:hypothetical protein
LIRPIKSRQPKVGEWIVRHRDQRAAQRIGSPQQCPQVVVLPEESVEPATHGDRRTVGQGRRPAAQPAAELLLPLQKVDGHAALGQRYRGRDAGDPTSDDSHARR